jgi:hypothetical protein
MPRSSDRVLGLQASGKLTDADYQDVFIPKLEAGLKAHGKLRVLLHLDETFEGWELKAMWDDASWGIKHRKDFIKLGVVGGPKWIEWGLRAGAHMVDAEVKAFGIDELEPAWEWLQS